MDIKKLYVNATSFAVALSITAGGTLALATPVFAMDEITNETAIEENIDNEVKEEKVEAKQEVQEEKVEKTEVVEEKTESKEEVKEEKTEEEKVEKTEEEKVEKTEEVTEEKTESKEEVKEETTEVKKEIKDEAKSETKEVSEEKEEAKEEATPTNENNKFTVNDSANQEHKVSVVTNKVDENGNPLVGATLQILDKDGNVVDEWVSDGTEHISLIPEGEYTLHEVGAPDGYVCSADHTFTVKVEEKDVVADVEHDDSHDVCWHYGGVALYYIESEGVREEVYCINQNWEEPDGINYDGLILDENNIRMFTPEADTTMSDNELYNKVLDIIYHRSKAEDLFPELSEVEIRFVTEYALKTFTSAEVTTKQAMRDENGRIIKSGATADVLDDPIIRKDYLGL